MPTTISFNNFKAFGPDMQTFTKKPITLIYGPNSVGKSSFLHAQLLLEYILKGNRTIDIDITNFAGDELDIGGFENYVHKRNSENKIRFDIKYQDIETISQFFLTDNYELLQLYEKNFLELPISIEIIEGKLAACFLDSGIKIKYFLQHFIENEKAVSETLDSYRAKKIYPEEINFDELYEKTKQRFEQNNNDSIIAAMREYCKTESISERQKKDFLEVFYEYFEQFKNSDDILLTAIKSTKRILSDKILSIFNFYKYILRIEDLQVEFILSQDNTILSAVYINKELLYSHYSDINEANEFNVEHPLIKHYTLFFSDSDDYTIESKEIDGVWPLELIMHQIIVNNHYISQYFGPLRPWPKRWELFSLPTADKSLRYSNKEKDDIIEYINKIYSFKYLSKYIKLVLLLLDRRGRSYLRQRSVITDGWNKLLPNKYKISGIGTFKSSDLWHRVSNSDMIQDKLNKWLEQNSNLKNKYRVHVKKHAISLIQVFGRYFERALGLESISYDNRKYREGKKTLAYRFGNIVIWLSRFIEKRLELKQNYENELVFTDMMNQTRVTPKEMGLGISQALPIVASSMSSQKTRFYIEQPELHLHPAFQMELLDEFIRSHHENENEFMIETHSEHMLLRIMKRMRHTAEGKVEADDTLALTPDDVCLLYVDNDGESTYLQELRLSPKGKLLDHWPNGFFEEGFKERFS